MPERTSISSESRGYNPLQDKPYYNGVINKYGITSEENFYNMLKTNRDFAKAYWYREWRDRKISKDDYDAIKADMGLTDFEDDSKFNQFMYSKGFDIAKIVAAAMSAYGGYLAYGALAGSQVIDKLDDKQSATSVASATGNDIIGTGKNTGYYGDSSSSSRPNTGIFGNILNGLFGSGSYSGSGILSALTGLGGQFASSAFNMQNTEKLIDKMNEYNTPANQMARFSEAGLNPNLIYGLGSNGNQNNAGTIAPVDFDTSQRENRMAQMQFDLAAKTAQADIAQKMSATQLNTANAAEADARRVAQENTNSIFGMQMQIVGAQLDEAIAQADLALKEANGWQEKRQAELDLLKAQKNKAQFDSMFHSSYGGLFGDIQNSFGEFTEGLEPGSSFYSDLFKKVLDYIFKNGR